jgi:predicted RNA-binding protein with PIN domain
MQWLIDGYNVMHAAGWLGARLGREAFRRTRRRFLDELAACFAPEDAEQITVVFDATAPPGDLPVDGIYRGMRVVFAVGDEDADARIEQMIAQHSHPKALTVVSSDRRIRQAAARRKAKELTARAFWDMIDRCHERAARTPRGHERGGDAAEEGRSEPSPEELAIWRETFRDALEARGQQSSHLAGESPLSPAEIAEIQKQLDRES